jgi:general secretion pathway protein A
MYKTFFGLHENPFNTNPDPRFLYLTPQTQEALDLLTYGIQNRKGCILLTGEVGTGKTTLINYLLDWQHRQNMPTAFIFNSHLNVNHLFDLILTDFGIRIDFRLKCNMHLQLTKWLLERFHAGEIPVLILDEAQGLSFELLEEVRILLNLEAASEKLLQIVLVGQPELEAKLKRPELRQFRQRIALRCTTAPLTLEESYGYIAGRLRIGGATGDPLFTSEAIEVVHFYSSGIPRVMNLLCEHALINAYVEQLNPVSGRMVEEAAREFLPEEFPAVATRSSLDNSPNRGLTVIPSISSNEMAHPFVAAHASLHESPHATIPLATMSFTEESPALTEEDRVTNATECDEMSVSDENHDLCGSSGKLIKSRSEQKENEMGLRVESIECPSDPAAKLVGDMKRLLAVVSPSAPPYLMPPRNGTEAPAATKSNGAAPSMNRAHALNALSQLPRNSRESYLEKLF